MPLGRRRPLMRAAIVGGAAYHAGTRVQRGREREQDQEARIEELEYQQPGPAPAPVAAAPVQARGISPDMIEQLKQLGQLHESGVLTDAEFEQQKQRLLNS